MGGLLLCAHIGDGADSSVHTTAGITHAPDHPRLCPHWRIGLLPPLIKQTHQPERCGHWVSEPASGLHNKHGEGWWDCVKEARFGRTLLSLAGSGRGGLGLVTLSSRHIGAATHGNGVQRGGLVPRGGGPW